MFCRCSSFRDAIVRRNDSFHSSLNSRQSPNVVSTTEINVDNGRRGSFDVFGGKQNKDQFCGSTPVLYTKQQHPIGSASPTPLPRIRRARSEAVHRSFKTRKGPPPKPPTPTEPDEPQSPLSSPPPLSPPNPFPFDPPEADQAPAPASVSIRRASDQSQDEGVILSDSAPSPASVVKALAPIFAPVFAVASLKGGMTGKSRQAPKLKGTGKSDSDSGFEVDNNIPAILAQDLPQISQVIFCWKINILSCIYAIVDKIAASYRIMLKPKAVFTLAIFSMICYHALFSYLGNWNDPISVATLKVVKASTIVAVECLCCWR
jgi:hypothetical protein